MRIISYNVNGIRAAIKKGFFEWLKTDPADVICLQETKATQGDVDVKQLEALGFHHYWYSAQKKGYSGVAIFTKIKPTRVIYGTGHTVSDDEGRVIQLDFGTVRLINAYFPSGTSGEVRQAYKYVWLDEMHTYLDELRKKVKKIILCGDYNIAHTELDLHDPKSNKKTTGFLPEEREWMTKFLDNNWIDTLREFNKAGGNYTWWSQRFPTLRAQNKGWRLDYISVTKSLQKQLVGASILCDIKHSDHCPVWVEIAV